MNSLVRDCMLLRRHALALFSRALAADAFVDEASKVMREAWWLFLAAEACATLVRQRLGIAAQRLPAPIAAVLDDACNAELQRMLAARLQLSIIDRAAGALEVTPVVLKGAVPIGEGKNDFDLGDVDLLLSRDECARLDEALHGIGGRDGGPAGRASAMRTDLHSTLDVGRGLTSVISALDTQPLGRFPNLRRLRPVPHAAYIVQHCTTQHPDRRGNLRDLMLLADVLRTLTPQERIELTDALARSSERRLYHSFLIKGYDLANGEMFADDPDTALMAAAHYEFSLRWPNTAGPVRHSIRGMATHFFGPATDISRAMRSYLFDPMKPGSVWLFPSLASRVPRLALFAAYVARTPYRVALLLYAAGAAMVFRLDYEQP